MNHSEIMNQIVNVKMTRDQLSFIRVAFSAWLDRKEIITGELTLIESLLNEYYPPVQSEGENKTTTGGLYMIPVYNNEGEIIAEVKYNSNLDYWDGRNYTSGSTGRHKGLARLTDGRYVLIYGTQWQGERHRCEIITPEQALQEILRSGNTDLLQDFPDLQELKENIIITESREEATV